MVDLLNLKKKDTKILVSGTLYPIDARGVCKGVAPEHADKMLLGKSWALWDGISRHDILSAKKKHRRENLKAGHDHAVAANLEKRITERVLDALARKGWGPSTPPVTPAADDKIQKKVLDAGYSQETATAVAEAEAAQMKADALLKAEDDAEDEADAVGDAEGKPDETPQEGPAADEAQAEASGDGVNAPPIPSAPDADEAKAGGDAGEEDPEDPPIPETEDAKWPDPDPRYSIEWLKACADAYEVSYPGNIGQETLSKKIMAAMYDED